MKRIINDVKTVFRRDPAAKNIIEVLLCYPGIHAIWFHRIAHFFYKLKFYTFARIISHISRFLTSIEIHPGAEIGEGVFIDHGCGVVIGETAQIGDNSLLYQGVVLGGTSLEKQKRHPTLMTNVIVGAGAIILGPVTISDNARIGAGAVVVTDIPRDATAVGIPAKIGIGFSGKDIEALEHGKLPDPVADAVRYVIKEQENIEKRIKELENLEGVKTHIDKVMEENKKEILKEFSISTNHDEDYAEGGGI